MVPTYIVTLTYVFYSAVPREIPSTKYKKYVSENRIKIGSSKREIIEDKDTYIQVKLRTSFFLKPVKNI